ANIYARWLTGLRVWDLTGGFKCFRREVLEAIDLTQVRSNGYAFQIEMSVRAWRKGFVLKEIPIVFVDRTEGSSKMNGAIVREAVGMVLETDAGSYESRSAGPGERAELRLAAVPAPTPVPGLAGTDGERRVALGLVGVPHLVVLVDDVSSVDLAPRGRALRSDPALG